MSKLKIAKKKSGEGRGIVAQILRDRTVKDLRTIELETISKAKQYVAEKEARKVQTVKLQLDLLPVTQLCGKKWQEVCRRLHGLPLFKPLDRVKLAGYAKRYSKGRGDFLMYMTWALENWRMVIDAKMGWMRDPPMLPAVPVFVRWSENFERMWMSKEETEALTKMTRREQIVHTAMKRGKTMLAAEREADEVMGITAERKKLEQEKKELHKARSLLVAESERAHRKSSVTTAREKARELLRSGAKEQFNQWEDEE